MCKGATVNETAFPVDHGESRLRFQRGLGILSGEDSQDPWNEPFVEILSRALGMRARRTASEGDLESFQSRNGTR